MQIDRIVGATLTASSTFTGYNVNDLKDDAIIGDVGYVWVSQDPAAGTEYVNIDLGSAMFLDTFLISTGYSNYNSAMRNGTVDSSDDAVSYTTRATITNLFGAAPTVAQYAIVSATRTSARYWRIAITNSWGTTYRSIGEVKAFDSQLLGAEILSGATGTFYNASAISTIAELTNRAFTNYGWYTANRWGILEIDFLATKYVGGFVGNHSNFIAYWPSAFWVYTSTDGAAWTLREIVTHGLADGLRHEFFAIAFSRIYATRYLRIMANGNAANGTYISDIFMHATLTPATPATPTSLIVTGDSDDNAALQLRWSQAAGDDNPVADLQWDVDRSFNGGVYSTVATVTAQEYIDTALAAGSYTYKVRAIGRYHAVASAYTAASAAMTVPVSAAGGGGAGRFNIGAGVHGR